MDLECLIEFRDGCKRGARSESPPLLSGFKTTQKLAAMTFGTRKGRSRSKHKTLHEFSGAAAIRLRFWLHESPVPFGQPAAAKTNQNNSTQSATACRYRLPLSRSTYTKASSNPSVERRNRRK
jgi:hypothetical protein